VVLTLIAGLFTTVQIIYQNRAETDRQQALSAQTENLQRFIQESKVQEASLQAYLDQMSTLLLQENLREAGDSSAVRAIAQARTATVIQKLDTDGNRDLIRFLNEAGLTGIDQSSISILAGADLRGAHLEDVDLSTIDLSGAILSGANLSGANLTSANLNGANLSGASLESATLDGAFLDNVDLSRANLSRASMAGASLSDSVLNEADLSKASLEAAVLNRTSLYEANLSRASMAGASLSDSVLSLANLSNARLVGAVLDDANLGGAELSSADLSGVNLRKADRDIIFDDGFASTSGGWLTGQGDARDPYVINHAMGGLRLYNPPPGNYLSTVPLTLPPIADASVEVDATVIGKDPERAELNWGIICRADDYNNTLFGIYADGRPTIWKLKDNVWDELDTESPSDAVRGGTATNHLRADCSGSRLALYVNDQKVLEAEDAKHKSGTIGLYVDDSFQTGQELEVLFDNFVVKGSNASFD
jgi:uncharacterized protein YjbI with pentapeptide repeats